MLLGWCYHRQGRLGRAAAAVARLPGEEARYLCALSLHGAGKLVEAEQALLAGRPLPASPAGGGEPAEGVGAGVPMGAAGCLLLGLICKGTVRPALAVKLFVRALELDPLQWRAYEELCGLGAQKEVQALLQERGGGGGLLFGAGGEGADVGAGAGGGLAVQATPKPGGGSVLWVHEEEEENVDPLQGGPGGGAAAAAAAAATAAAAGAGAGAGAAGGGAGDAASTPNYATPQVAGPGGAGAVSGAPRTGGMATPPPGSFETPLETPAARDGAGVPGGRGGLSATGGASGAPPPTSGPPPAPGGQKRKLREDGRHLRTSTRLSFSEPGSVPPAGALLAETPVSAAGPTPGGGGGPRALLQPPPEAPGAGGGGARTVGAWLSEAGGGPGRLGARGAEAEAGRGEGDAAALQLLQNLAGAYCLLCGFQCKEALEAFARLPPEQGFTGWVLCHVGKAHFELSDYAEAARHFEWARRADPTRLEGMEVYSTVLWHLKREAELAFLAHEALALDRLAPETWCIMGNCLSLQREHEAALRLFQRSLQLDPQFVYAHTLCGHEHVASEDFDKGLGCYRNALRLDSRHYNAWYGIGQVHFQQEKYELADYHFRRAAKIHPGSSKLLCCLGRALHRRGQHAEALHYLQGAVQRDPVNPLARFERASVLFSQDSLEEARQELLELRQLAPREPNVHFLLGKVYKRLGETGKAVKSLFAALDLKPSGRDVGTIKSAIEKIKISDEAAERWGSEEDFEF